MAKRKCAAAEVSEVLQTVEDADVTPEDSCSDYSSFYSHKHRDSDLDPEPDSEILDEKRREQEQEEDGSDEDYELAPMPSSPVSPGLQAEAQPPPASAPRREEESQPQQNGPTLEPGPLAKRPKRSSTGTPKYSLSGEEDEGEEDEEFQPPLRKELTPSQKVPRSPRVASPRNQSRPGSKTPTPSKRGGSADNQTTASTKKLTPSKKVPRSPRVASPRNQSRLGSKTPTPSKRGGSADNQTTASTKELTPSKKVPRSPRVASARKQSRLGSTPAKGDGSAEEGRWRNMEEEDTAPPPARFVPARVPGPVLDKTKSWKALELFQLFFSSTVVNTIIKNTNRNAQRQRQAGKKYPWKPLNVKDFYLFLAIIIYTGLTTLHERQDYWKKGFPYGHPFPANTMTRSRFEAIVWSLHLSDPTEEEENNRKRGTPEYDRLFNIKPLYTEIVVACKSFFQPYRDISIDERMVASKARISMKQYHKDKPTKWGYKLYVLADSSTGYTWNFFVYSGKGSADSEQGLSYSSVMDLMHFSMLGSGYSLYVDNFYTSPALFIDLAAKNTRACGTIRRTRFGFPKTADNDLPANAQRGDIRWIRKDDLLFVKWMDKREVTICSSIHKAYSGETVRRKVKEEGVWQIKQVPCPDAVVAYNKNMGGVDLSDALIGYYSVLYKTMRWYKTFFYHFMDIAVVNGHILHKELVKARADGTKPLTQKQFREQLCQEMVTFAKDSEPTAPAPQTKCMPMYYGTTGHAMRRFCRKCSEEGLKKVKTSVYCRKCDVPLCMSAKKNCFTQWHDAK